MLRAKNLRPLSFNPAGANSDLIDPVHQLGDEMKLKAGVAKGRDLPFRRENNLRILNGVFDIVLFQNSAGKNTTEAAQYREAGNPKIVDRPRSIGHTASFHVLDHPARGLNSDQQETGSIPPRSFFSMSGSNAS